MGTCKFTMHSYEAWSMRHGPEKRGKEAYESREQSRTSGTTTALLALPACSGVLAIFYG